MVTTIVNLALPADHPARKIEINGYQADSYSEGMSEPNFENQDIMGRSPIAIYGSSGSRTVSFSMMFHRDMFGPTTMSITGYKGMPVINNVGNAFREIGREGNDFNAQINENTHFMKAEVERIKKENKAILDKNYNLIKFSQQVQEEGYGDIREQIAPMLGRTDNRTPLQINMDRIEQERAEATANFATFVNQLKALNYPVYSTNGVIAPSVYLKVGNSIRLKGYCTVSIEWDGLVNLNQLISCTASFNFTEVVDQSWSATEVYEGMQRYITYADEPLGVR